MRELKFRVWNNRYSEYIRPDYNIIGYIYPLDGTLGVSSGDQDGHIIEQFTGLKDKNDKEIYEGDILQKYEGGALCVVYWDDEELQWYVKEKLLDCPDGGLLFNLKYLGDEKVVIGNIHENPELLENE